MEGGLRLSVGAVVDGCLGIVTHAVSENCASCLTSCEWKPYPCN